MSAHLFLHWDANKRLKKKYDVEVITAEKTLRTERKNLTKNNRELSNTVWTLRVSAISIYT
jgi:hypothetical protein